MAKEAELLSLSYKSLKIVPVAAAAVGEVLTSGSAVGFLLEAITAAQVALSEERALIYDAEIVKVPKNPTEVWVAGEPIYFDAAASDFSNVAGTLDAIGFVREAAASADTHGFITWVEGAEFLKT